jgi:stage II sporulation protein P
LSYSFVVAGNVEYAVAFVGNVNKFRLACVLAVLVTLVYAWTHGLLSVVVGTVGTAVAGWGGDVLCPYPGFAAGLDDEGDSLHGLLGGAVYPLYALASEKALAKDDAAWGQAGAAYSEALASGAASTSEGSEEGGQAAQEVQGNAGEEPFTDGSAASGEAQVSSGGVTQAASQGDGDTGGTYVDGGTLQVASSGIMTGMVYPRSSLESFDFLYKNFYTVTSITELTGDKLRPAEFLAKDMTVAHDSSTPQILIFHTHSQEEFADSVEGDDTTTIVGVGDYLAQLLTEVYGYNVIHDRGVYDVVDGKLDRSKAYTYAEEAVEELLLKYPSIDMVIDLHRDGVSDDTRLVTEVNGKQTAKVMFFNGLSYSKKNGSISYLPNPNLDDNLALSLQMQLLGNAYYPDFLRRIYVNAYRYCLHLRGKSMLIEAGAQTNTLQEVKNAMEPLADLIDRTLKGERYW